MKRCKRCGAAKALDEFYRSPGMPDGHRNDRNEYNLAGHLKPKYGVTVEQPDAMLAVQGGGCSTCGRPPREDISLHVDHDHSTAEIRGHSVLLLQQLPG